MGLAVLLRLKLNGKRMLEGRQSLWFAFLLTLNWATNHAFASPVVQHGGKVELKDSWQRAKDGMELAE